MNDRNQGAFVRVPALLAAAALAFTFIAIPAQAATLKFQTLAGFFAPSGYVEFDIGVPAQANQGGLEFFTAVTAPLNPADPTYGSAYPPPVPPNTWTGVAWGCLNFQSGCANGGNTGTLTGAPVPNDGSGRSFLLMNGLFGTLTSTFQDIAVIQGHNNVIFGNVLGAADINLFLRLGPNGPQLGPLGTVSNTPKSLHVDFYETFNDGSCTTAVRIRDPNNINVPLLVPNAPVNPLGSNCDDYAVVSRLDLSSVPIPANSPFGNTVPLIVDFQLSGAPGAGSLVCTGLPSQPIECGSYAGGGDPFDPKILVYTKEGSQNTVSIQARVREPDQGRPLALFVIGDVEPHAVGNVVNFWGAQWWKNNVMSGFVSNGVASFKGFASNADDFCGGVWQSRPGNSSNPPDTIPADVAIIVTDTVVKDGPNISGTIKQIVIVHQDGNYGPNPGHRGGGPVTTIQCP